MNETLQFEDVFQQPEKKDIEVKSIEETFDIPEVKVEVEIKFDPIETKGDKQDFSDDINYVRTKLLHSIGKADKILDNLLAMISMDEKLIEMSQPPKGYYRYYDVSTQLLKSITDASKELINLHSQNLKIKKDMEWLEVVEVKEEDKIVNKKVKLNDLIRDVKNATKGETDDEI